MELIERAVGVVVGLVASLWVWVQWPRWWRWYHTIAPVEQQMSGTWMKDHIYRSGSTWEWKDGD
jgi:hypothetical protein